METIAIKVDAEISKAYQAAEPQKQQKIQTIVNDLLKLIIQDKSLDDIIQEMQEQAKNKGLTPEILNEILENG
jgi:calcineurin-like phosphoesterase